ncbi:MAG TPA: PPC domain-containing DNA-binding protein, partial [Candidatus Thermoplasmatota archaeon]|nr:PPC domain-containing DNA-binding protein [Candidatus Thermoplasmatota archaeon]
MPARRSGDDWFVHFEPGQELHDAYRGFAREQGVRSAAIVAGIGMIKDPELGFFDGARYQTAALRGAFELVSTQGNLALL